MSAVSALTVELGRKLAPIIVDQGGKMLPDSVKKKVEDDDGKSTMEDVVKVAVSGVKGTDNFILCLLLHRLLYSLPLSTNVCLYMSRRFISLCFW